MNFKIVQFRSAVNGFKEALLYIEIDEEEGHYIHIKAWKTTEDGTFLHETKIFFQLNEIEIVQEAIRTFSIDLLIEILRNIDK